MSDTNRRLATQPLHMRMALVFDFDATLAPSSIDALLERLGHDPETFRGRNVQPLIEENRFEVVLAGFYALIRESRSRNDGKITRELLQEVGRSLELFPGVSSMFDRVRGWAHAIVPEVDVEFYVVTSGHEEIHKASCIAHEFNAIWGSEFHFDESGEVAFPRRVLTFREKRQYVLQLVKGTGTAGPNSPADAYAPLSAEELHLPLDQVVYLGDGASDLPVFELLHDNGGISIAVSKTGDVEEWEPLSKMRPGRRVENVARGDYRDGSELMRSLQLAVECICKRIALRKLGHGE
jgi:phosphoserine phosphatase